MALIKILGSKSEAFHREGHSWLCRNGLPSDVIVEVREMSFHLHKFPLLPRSGLLKKLIEELCSDIGSAGVLILHDIPGGAKAFELIAKFCYGVKIELTALNVVSLRCAAEFLHMTDNYGEGNLIMETEAFLEEVFSNWEDTMKALETCEQVLTYAEDLRIVSRCINSLAMKACADPNLFNWPVPEWNETQSTEGFVLWNGISTVVKPKPIGDDWWFEDVSSLSLFLYKRFILALKLRSIKLETISSSLIYYAKRYIPLMNRQSSFNEINHINLRRTISTLSQVDQRALLEEIVELLPNKKDVTSTEFLLRLLRTAMVLKASQSCKENLEKRVGSQLEQASLVDILLPKMESIDTLYDIDCVQRMLDHFMSFNHPAAALFFPCIMEEGQPINGSDSMTPTTLVAALVDGYLTEVAPDVNLKQPKFEALAAVIPGYARPLDDGLYHAIDIYLKAHPWITGYEREQLCRLMDCQKLSVEASTHAARNERLPLRVVVQVLFFELLRLRNSISGWFFVDNLENSQNPGGSLGHTANKGCQQIVPAEDQVVGHDEMKELVLELEKKCSSMKQELQKLVKTKKTWRIIAKILGFKQKWKRCYPEESKHCTYNEPVASMNRKQNHKDYEVVH